MNSVFQLPSFFGLFFIFLVFGSCKKDETDQAGTNLPVLTTKPVLAVTATTAGSGGNISSVGGDSITARGVCWSTSQNPTISSGGKTSDGIGGGVFTSKLGNLIPNTLYYVRAYATNRGGTAYGNEVSFKTNSLTNLIDADSNIYKTIAIGSQVWMKENLRVSKFRNGSAIPTNLTDAAWQSTTSGAFAIYNNNIGNDTIYGKLYNWYAVADPRGLCPAGWHVPTEQDWQLLTKYLDQTADTSQCCSNSAGGKMKSIGTLQSASGLWQDPNAYATNISGFSGLPGGCRLYDGSYPFSGYYGHWWTSTEKTSVNAWRRFLGHEIGHINRSFEAKVSGYSVRCIKD